MEKKKVLKSWKTFCKNLPRSKERRAL